MSPWCGGKAVGLHKLRKFFDVSHFRYYLPSSSSLGYRERGTIPIRVGNILATDFFYDDEYPDEWKLWTKYGVLAVEMESAELYTRAALYGIRALTILMVSDVIPTGESLGPEDRKKVSKGLIQIALSI